MGNQLHCHEVSKEQAKSPTNPNADVLNAIDCRFIGIKREGMLEVWAYGLESVKMAGHLVPRSSLRGYWNFGGAPVHREGAPWMEAAT